MRPRPHPADNPESVMDDLNASSPWQTARFELQIQIDRRDYLQMMRTVRWTAREYATAWLATVGISGIGALVALFTLEPFAVGLPAYPYWDWGTAIVIGGALAAFLLYKALVLGPSVDDMFKGQPIGMGETTIVADSTAVNATATGIATRVPWDRIENVIVTNDQLFLMYGRLTGLIIPRRAFTDVGEAQRFVDFVRSMAHKPA